MARRAVWENEARQDILIRYLQAGVPERVAAEEEIQELLKLVETYHPNDAQDLLARIPHWETMLRQEVSAAGNPKAFLNERVEELHGGGRDQRRQDDTRLRARQRELAFLEKLTGVLGHK